MKKERTIWWAWWNAVVRTMGVLTCAYILYMCFYHSWYYLPLIFPALFLFWIGDIGIEELMKRAEKNIKCWKDANAETKDNQVNLHKKGRKREV